MASQMGYRGRMGNVIHYKMGEKYYSRSAPKKYEQTDATKARAKVFGRASSIGALLRKDLASVIPNSSDRKMQSRLVAEIFAWLQRVGNRPAAANNQPSFDFLFSLNTEAPRLSNRWNVKVQVINPSPGILQITIPAFIPNQAIVAPPDAVEIICKIATTVIDIVNIERMGKHKTEIIYPFEDQEAAEQIIPVQLPMPPGSLVVTALSLVYIANKYDSKEVITNDSFAPSKIIHMIYL
jgi:hypothetical protein